MPPFPPLPLQNPPRSSALLLHHIANLSPLLPLPPPPCGFSASYPGHPTFHLCPLSTSLPPSQVCLCAASLNLPPPCPDHSWSLTQDPSPVLSVHGSRFYQSVKVACKCQFLFCTKPFITTTFFIALDHGSCLAHVGVSFLTVAPRFLLLHCLPCLKPKHLAPCWEVTQNPEACTGWTMLLHGHCPVVCHPSPSPGQDPIRQTSNGSEKIVDLGQVRVICQGSPTVKTQACPGVKETQFSHFPEHLVFGLELLNVCQMEKNWRSFSRGMTKGNSLESGIKSKEKRVNLAGKRVDTKPH